MLRTTPPTNIQSSHPLTPAQAHIFLTSFIHFSSTTRPLRNRHRASLENVSVLPFSPSVLNNLKRIEMGLRGEYVKPAPSSFHKKYPVRNTNNNNDDHYSNIKKRKIDGTGRGEETGEDAQELFLRMDESVNESAMEGSRKEEVEREIAIRDYVPEVHAGSGSGGEEKESESIQPLSKKDKEMRKKHKKTRRKEDKKARDAARKRAKENEGGRFS